MQVIPGTHSKDQMPHRDSFADGNMLSRGQEIAVAVDQSKAVDVVLRPGEMSLHHVRIAHGSQHNRSQQRRVGFAIRYIPTHIRQTGTRTTALLVRGIDEHGNFDPEPIPSAEFEPSAVAFHAQALARLSEVGYAGAGNAKRRF
jgi:ectoine hydroxylase-related dioxygenase (phytanoyl-CoA dioxygenase family)